MKLEASNEKTIDNGTKTWSKIYFLKKIVTQGRNQGTKFKNFLRQVKMTTSY